MAVGSAVRGLRPRRNPFNLSHDIRLTCRFGELIPILIEDAIPGDTWRLGLEKIVRFLPMAKPIMHRVKVQAHYFFIPYRLLWKHWETFYTGGQSGNATPQIPKVWNPDAAIQLAPPNSSSGTDLHSLWDYFGFPVVNFLQDSSPKMPVCFPWRAYHRIWWEYYRDQDLQRFDTDWATPGAIFGSNVIDSDFDMDWWSGFVNLENEERVPYQWDSIKMANLRFRNWHKDYFTASRPWQQRGDAPALPVQGHLPIFGGLSGMPGVGLPLTMISDQAPALGYNVISYTGANNVNQGQIQRQIIGGIDPNNMASGTLNSWYADANYSTTFDVADLRLAFQIQKWMERNARGGVRYNEAIRAHFGESPRDDRLQRAEYIGGVTSWVEVSEVLQTSETGGTPQGEMAGHGLDYGGERVGSYKVLEPGIIIGILSIMPDQAYENGIDRNWTKETRFDYYFPEFANLSEQAIERGEIFWTGTQADKELWGFIPRYDEYRHRTSKSVSEMRVNLRPFQTSLADWHLGRDFQSSPNLNSQFISMEQAASRLNRVFHYSDPEARNILIDCHHHITAIRPMPHIAEPGLIDHH